MIVCFPFFRNKNLDRDFFQQAYPQIFQPKKVEFGLSVPSFQSNWSPQSKWYVDALGHHCIIAQSCNIMRVSKVEESDLSTSSTISQCSKQQQKPPNPAVSESLKTYEMLKRQLYGHFFNDQPLNINNKDYAESYSSPFLLVNCSQYAVTHNKRYQSIEQTFLDIYKTDLKAFAERISERIVLAKGMQSDEFIASIARWMNAYARFNHWIYRTFMIIERNSMRAKGHKLYFYGIEALKQEVIDKIYNELYAAIVDCLELYKQGKLREYEPLQTVIKYIGIMGFTKFKLVDMAKTDSQYEYSSTRMEGEQPEHPYDTNYFKKNFIAKLTKDIRIKYTQIVNEMMQLSTPEYFQKVKAFIEAEEMTADHFYGFKHSKDIVMHNVLEILVVEKAEGLLKNAKSGFGRMMRERDVANLAKIYTILKKANMLRLFYRQFQNYIHAEGQQILNKISNEQERVVKGQTIISVIGQIIKYNDIIQKLRKQIDICDVDLHKAQTIGFQGFCNTSNKVCNYLAFYTDLMLKMDDAVSLNSESLISQVSRISKYLYSYDYFMKMYQKLMGLRILYDNFKNQEAEYALIALLKSEAGVNAASKLTNMISDQKSSEAWNLQFQLRNRFSFGFNVMMLTSGSWEINDPKCGKSLVPPQLISAVQEFELKFLQKMPNRTVSWIFTHGRGIVQVVNNSGAKFVLVLNNYQLITLLHLQNNGYRAVKYGDLVTSLKIQDDTFFKSSIISLLRHGVLVNATNLVKIQSKCDELHFNFDFKSKSQKVGCIVTPRYTEKTANIGSEVSAERCILIDAVLVKIMKQRKRAMYSEVISEVQKMCKTFKAEVAQIKLRIENCQQREFLERDGNDMNLLIYKP